MPRATAGLLGALLLSILVAVSGCTRCRKDTDVKPPADGAVKLNPIIPDDQIPDDQFGFREVTVDKFAGMNGAQRSATT